MVASISGWSLTLGPKCRGSKRSRAAKGVAEDMLRMPKVRNDAWRVVRCKAERISAGPPMVVEGGRAPNEAFDDAVALMGAMCRARVHGLCWDNGAGG